MTQNSKLSHFQQLFFFTLVLKNGNGRQNRFSGTKNWVYNLAGARMMKCWESCKKTLSGGGDKAFYDTAIKKITFLRLSVGT